MATETGKLLSGLAGGGANDEDAEDDEDENGEPKQTRKVGSSPMETQILIPDTSVRSNARKVVCSSAAQKV